MRTPDATYAVDLRGPWLLFDHRADPYQQRNLVDDPAAAMLRATLRAELERWMKRTGDTLESKTAILARHGLTAAWIERETHFRALRDGARAPRTVSAPKG